MYYVKLSIKSDELRQRVSQIFSVQTKRVYETKKKTEEVNLLEYSLRVKNSWNRHKQKNSCHINRIFAFDREQKHTDYVSKETEFQVEGYVRNTSEIME